MVPNLVFFQGFELAGFEEIKGLCVLTIRDRDFLVVRLPHCLKKKRPYFMVSLVVQRNPVNKTQHRDRTTMAAVWQGEKREIITQSCIQND